MAAKSVGDAERKEFRRKKLREREGAYSVRARDGARDAAEFRLRRGG